MLPTRSIHMYIYNIYLSLSLSLCFSPFFFLVLDAKPASGNVFSNHSGIDPAPSLLFVTSQGGALEAGVGACKPGWNIEGSQRSLCHMKGFVDQNMGLSVS